MRLTEQESPDNAANLAPTSAAPAQPPAVAGSQNRPSNETASRDMRSASVRVPRLSHHPFPGLKCSDTRCLVYPGLVSPNRQWAAETGFTSRAWHLEISPLAAAMSGKCRPSAPTAEAPAQLKTVDGDRKRFRNASAHRGDASGSFSSCYHNPDGPETYHVCTSHAWMKLDNGHGFIRKCI